MDICGPDPFLRSISIMSIVNIELVANNLTGRFAIRPRHANEGGRIRRNIFLSACALFLVCSFVLTSCSTSSSASTQPVKKLRIGYLASLTHAPAIIGIEANYFADALDNIKIETKAFNSGVEVIESIFSGALDVAFIGPNPALNGFIRSKGKAVVVIANATNGGAALITKPEIQTIDDLRGKTLATPSLGNTQDIALRAWLRSQNLSSSRTGSGDVEISPRENADTLTAFRNGDIDGAWVPEPWATRLVLEGNGHVFLDERSLWPSGEFATTLVIAKPDFAQRHPETIQAFLNGLKNSIDFAMANPSEAQKLVNAGIYAVTTKKISEKVLTEAWKSLSFSIDTNQSVIETTRDHAVRENFLPNSSLDGFIDNQFLESARKQWTTP